MNPERCMMYNISTQTKNNDGEFVAEIGVVKFGETGYYPTTYGLQSQEWVKWYNEERLGIKPEESEAMTLCSMFNSWDNYESIKESMAKRLSK